MSLNRKLRAETRARKVGSLDVINKAIMRYRAKRLTARYYDGAVTAPIDRARSRENPVSLDRQIGDRRHRSRL